MTGNGTNCQIIMVLTLSELPEMPVTARETGVMLLSLMLIVGLMDS